MGAADDSCGLAVALVAVKVTTELPLAAVVVGIFDFLGFSVAILIHSSVSLSTSPLEESR